MATTNRLKGVTHILDSLLSDQLETNLVEYFKNALLHTGAFFNVGVSQSGTHGGDFSQLRVSEDPYFTKGQVWEGLRQDWVYESGVEYVTQPIAISGVYVNNTFYSSTTTGAFSHYIDYPRGRVIFHNAISSTSTVKCAHSPRYVHFNTSDASWFKTLQFNSMRADDTHFLQYGSGGWAMLGQTRIQLPAVIVEATPRRHIEGYQLGGGEIIFTDVHFHIYAEHPFERKQLVDTISYQQNKRIRLFDKNLLASQDKFPLDANGSLRSGALQYPDLVKGTGEGGCFWRLCVLHNIQGFPIKSNPPLFEGLVKITCEVIMPEL